MQSIRLLAADNVTMKKIAKRNGVTFNRWAVAVLMREVKREEKRLDSLSRKPAKS